MSKVNIESFATLDEAIKSGQVWIYNNSDSGGIRKKGQLIFYIQTQDGNKIPVRIPPTWIPINMLDIATLEDLQRCTTLRQYIGHRIIIAITPDSVTELKNSPNYKTEAERVNRLMSGFEALATANPTSLTVNTSGSGIVQGNKAVDPNGVADIQRSALVTKVLEADSSQMIVSILDAELKNVTLVDAQQIGLGATSGSFLERLASELEGYLTEDGSLPFNSIEETDAVSHAKADGTFGAPTISF